MNLAICAATFDEARKRYKSYTRGVLKDRFLKRCDSGEWILVEGFPSLVNPEDHSQVYLHYRRDPSKPKLVFGVIGHPNIAKR